MWVVVSLHFDCNNISGKDKDNWALSHETRQDQNLEHGWKIEKECGQFVTCVSAGVYNMNSCILYDHWSLPIVLSVILVAKVYWSSRSCDKIILDCSKTLHSYLQMFDWKENKDSILIHIITKKKSIDSPKFRMLWQNVCCLGLFNCVFNCMFQGS